MQPIGGYFELELQKQEGKYHETPHRLKSGRSSINFILRSMQAELVYVPFYGCDTLLQPIRASNIKYVFYNVDQLFNPIELPELNEREYFLYINYFDLKRSRVNELSVKYGNRLIVDCTQAFFQKGNGISWYFNSCRKFFGVPDGSFLYTPDNIALGKIATRNHVYSIAHLIKRFNGDFRGGYELFLENEELVNEDIEAMSILSEHLLSLVDYGQVAIKRRTNFKQLHEAFSGVNLIKWDDDAESVPMYYPLLTERKIDKQQLFPDNIFVPFIWSDVFQRAGEGFSSEKEMAANLLPLPIDHRYGPDDMERMILLIKNLL